MSLELRPTFLPSNILIHVAIWPQQIWTENWGYAPLGRGLGPYLTQCGHGRVLPACQVSSRSIQPFGTIHQRHRQDRQTDRQRTVPWHRVNRFTNGCPKMVGLKALFTTEHQWVRWKSNRPVRVAVWLPEVAKKPSEIGLRCY